MLISTRFKTLPKSTGKKSCFKLKPQLKLCIVYGRLNFCQPNESETADLNSLRRCIIYELIFTQTYNVIPSAPGEYTQILPTNIPNLGKPFIKVWSIYYTNYW